MSTDYTKCSKPGCGSHTIAILDTPERTKWECPKCHNIVTEIKQR